MKGKDVFSYHLTLVRKRNGRYDKRREYSLDEFFSEVDKSSDAFMGFGLKGLNKIFKLPSVWRLFSSKVKKRIEKDIAFELGSEYDKGFLAGRVGMVLDVARYKDELLKKRKSRKVKK